MCVYFTQEHECKLTQEILELIDREVDLMMRGVKHQNLEGLRKRIATLFFQYIKTPLFNPEVARHLKVLYLFSPLYSFIRILCLEEPGAGYCPWGSKESDMTEQLHFSCYSKMRYIQIFFSTLLGVHVEDHLIDEIFFE